MSVHENQSSVNYHLQPAKSLPSGNLATRDYFRSRERSYADPDEVSSNPAFETEREIQSDRRTASRSQAALALLTAEHGLSDKSTRLLLALCGISDGRVSFNTTYLTIYGHLRKLEPSLKNDKGETAPKVNQTVRRYIKALLKDQAKTGVAYAEIQEGTKLQDGTTCPTQIKLPVIEFLDEINQRVKSHPSYSRDSRNIRRDVTRQYAAELRVKGGYTAEQENLTNPTKKIGRQIKQSAGMLNSIVSVAKQHGYTNEAIRAWLVKELPDSVKAILFPEMVDTADRGEPQPNLPIGIEDILTALHTPDRATSYGRSDTADSEGWEHGGGGESVLTPMIVPLRVSGQDNKSDTLPNLQDVENVAFSEQASVDVSTPDAATDHAAVVMVDSFASVGAETFDLTTTDEAGGKVEFQRGLSIERLKSLLPDLLKRCELANLNVIVRPQLRVGVSWRLVQLDDLALPAVERVKQFAFMVIETSPGSHQAWLAVEQASDDAARRLKKATGADATASGATRIAGSRNFKPKHAPAYPVVKVLDTMPALTVTVAELVNAGMVAEESGPAPARRHAPIPADRLPQSWPSYQRCLTDSPKARNHDGPDRSHADFEFCLIAADRGWPAEAIAQRLMLESAKAEREGFKYALHTAQRAAAVVASRREVTGR